MVFAIGTTSSSAETITNALGVIGVIWSSLLQLLTISSYGIFPNRDSLGSWWATFSPINHSMFLMFHRQFPISTFRAHEDIRSIRVVSRISYNSAEAVWFRKSPFIFIWRTIAQNRQCHLLVETCHSHQNHIKEVIESKLGRFVKKMQPQGILRLQLFIVL